MNERPPLSYIVERGRQLVRREDYLMAIQAESTTTYDLSAHADLGDWIFKLRTGGRFYIGERAYVPRMILVCKGSDITVEEADLDLVYDRILPALEQALVLDELADI